MNSIKVNYECPGYYCWRNFGPDDLVVLSPIGTEIPLRVGQELEIRLEESVKQPSGFVVEIQWKVMGNPKFRALVNGE